MQESARSQLHGSWKSTPPPPHAHSDASFKLRRKVNKKSEGSVHWTLSITAAIKNVSEYLREEVRGLGLRNFLPKKQAAFFFKALVFQSLPGKRRTAGGDENWVLKTC